MRDVTGDTVRGMRHIRNTFEDMATRYGYSPVQPPVIELLDTLQTKSGPAIRDEIYNFADKGGREVGLRFDFTMGMTRHATSDMSLAMPAKMYAYGGVFRYDEPQKGRYRHFHQWDLEVYGRPHIIQDAELILFTAELLDALQIDCTIRLSHRGIMEGYITGTVGPDAVPDMLRAADKTSKKESTHIIQEYADRGYDASDVEAVLQMASVHGTASDVYDALPDTIQKGVSWQHTQRLYDIIHESCAVQVDLGIVRGLDYYTGMVFEAFGPAPGALAGGGRYDTLPGAFGRPEMGAAGVAGGVERILEMMGYGPVEPATISVIYHDTLYDVALQLAVSLRRRGAQVVMDTAGRSLKKQMGVASSCQHAIILAPREMADGMAIVRHMENGSQRLVPYDTLTQEMPW